MANHCNIHFKNKITFKQLEDTIKFYCRERLGDESLVSSEDGYISVKVPSGVDGFEQYAQYWLNSSRDVEHRHISSFGFGTNILHYVGWKLKATHSTDESDDVKSSCLSFLSYPQIQFIDIHDHLIGTPLKILSLLAPRFDTIYKHENNFIAKINQASSFFYVTNTQEIKPDYFIKYEKAYHKRLKKILKMKEQNDCFFGDPIRAALGHGNYPLANDLINNNFTVSDNLDLSIFKKPDYISEKYLNEVSMPLLNLTIHSIESNCNPSDIYEVTKNLMNHGADPFLKDSRGLDALDCFFLNRAVTTLQSEMIFKAFKENIPIKNFREKIQNSNLSDLKKELFLSKIKTLNLKNKM